MSIKTIIVEDEINNLEHLQRLVSVNIPDVVLVATAMDIESAQEAILFHQPELVLLDIQLKDHTAFDLLRRLPEIYFEIIFITAYDHYGIQAIKFSALDYLLKPVTKDDLAAAILKAFDRIRQKKKNKQLDNLLDFLAAGSPEQKKLALPLQDEIRYEPITAVVRFEASNNYCYVFLDTGERLLVSRTLKTFAVMLESYGFIRTHQSHLVNSRYVKSFLKEDGGLLLLSDTSKIPISKTHRLLVKERLGQLP
jgi:two-component system LytT family response regulator